MTDAMETADSVIEDIESGEIQARTPSLLPDNVLSQLQQCSGMELLH